PHVSSGVRSAGCNLIATLVFGMSETIAITGKSVKLFKGHYTRTLLGNSEKLFLGFFRVEKQTVRFLLFSRFQALVRLKPVRHIPMPLEPLNESKVP
ncbi:MAG: hypothetical protein ACREYE_06980, partial [Gammaproteobacteria bacterium]